MKRPVEEWTTLGIAPDYPICITQNIRGSAITPDGSWNLGKDEWPEYIIPGR